MNEKEVTEPQESGWQKNSKLVGYGLFSLVFRPPVVLPDANLFPHVGKAVRENPFDFVGLLTTHELYQNQIRTTTRLLKELSSRNSQFSNLIVFPVPLSENQDFVMLQMQEVQELLEKYHAVRKRVEYERTWEAKQLVQLIYPYAGLPLEQFCKNPKNVPTWTEFFQGMAEIGRALVALHMQGYVHGDLSPNNLLYQQSDQHTAKFIIVDWNMMSRAENFLQQRKGRNRVACWSPEHFSLTTSRLENLEEDRHWLIYAEEMQKYIARLLEFTFSTRERTSDAIRNYFEPYTKQGSHPMFQAMYNDLKVLSAHDPAAIAKYHDVRYFMDTVAKCVSAIFPNRTQAQQTPYNFFIALCLAQNTPDRSIYLEDPDRLAERLLMILKACEDAAEEPLSSPDDLSPPVKAELTLLNLLR